MINSLQCTHWYSENNSNCSLGMFGTIIKNLNRKLTEKNIIFYFAQNHKIKVTVKYIQMH